MKRRNFLALLGLSPLAPAAVQFSGSPNSVFGGGFWTGGVYFPYNQTVNLDGGLGVRYDLIYKGGVLVRVDRSQMKPQ